MRGQQRAWRSPWTVGLAVVLLGLAAVAIVRSVTAPGYSERLLEWLFAVAAIVGGVRALRVGVVATPDEVVIRELTKTTRVPWSRVVRVTWEPLARKGAHAPVLRLAPERAVKGGPRGRAAEVNLTLTSLGTYREAVAQRRAEQIADARPAK